MTNDTPPTGWPRWLILLCLIGGLALWVWIIGWGVPAAWRWLAGALG